VITALSLFGMLLQAWHTCVWGVSPTLLYRFSQALSGWKLYGQFLEPHGLVLLGHTLLTVRPHIVRRVPFQIMSNQLHLTQVESNQVVETSQG
jgi:hypothetical protein